ncbi:MAG: hypothetical protein JNL11_14110 [Bdellovibrionaceae bacterium]|nr:hypothetical protein [Pseudobdellovibrionaceae bacterium]
MNALNLVIFLFFTILISFFAHAKTEAGIAEIGFNSKKQSRTIANTAQGLDALSKLNNMSETPHPIQKYETTYAGFAGSEGALTKKRAPANRKKSAKK